MENITQMLNVKYWRIFRDVVSLFIQVFIISPDRVYEEMSALFCLKCLMAMFLGYDSTLCDMYP